MSKTSPLQRGDGQVRGETVKNHSKIESQPIDHTSTIKPRTQVSQLSKAEADLLIEKISSDWNEFCQNHQILVRKSQESGASKERLRLKKLCEEFFSQRGVYEFLGAGCWGIAFKVNIENKTRVIKLGLPGAEDGLKREKSSLLKLEHLKSQYDFFQILSRDHSGNYIEIPNALTADFYPGMTLIHHGQVNPDFIKYGLSDDFILNFLSFAVCATELGVDISDMAGKHNAIYDPEQRRVYLIDFDGQYNSRGLEVPEPLSNPLTAALLVLVTRLLNFESPESKDDLEKFCRCDENFKVKRYMQLERVLVRSVKEGIFSQQSIVKALNDLTNLEEGKPRRKNLLASSTINKDFIPKIQKLELLIKTRG